MLVLLTFLWLRAAKGIATDNGKKFLSFTVFFKRVIVPKGQKEFSSCSGSSQQGDTLLSKTNCYNINNHNLRKSYVQIFYTETQGTRKSITNEISTVTHAIWNGKSLSLEIQYQISPSVGSSIGNALSANVILNDNSSWPADNSALTVYGFNKNSSERIEVRHFALKYSICKKHYNISDEETLCSYGPNKNSCVGIAGEPPFIADDSSAVITSGYCDLWRRMMSRR